MDKENIVKKLRKTGKTICRFVALAFLFCVFGGVAIGQTNDSSGKKYKIISPEITEDNFQFVLTDDGTGVRVFRFTYKFEDPKCDGAFIDVLKIPETIQGFPVKELSAERGDFFIIETEVQDYSKEYGINRLELPDSVEIIREGTFKQGSIFGPWGSKSFKSIKLSKSLKKIEKYAFADFAYLETVEFPASCQLAVIEERAFQNCKVLNNIELPDTVEKIGESAFSGCESLDKVKFPKNEKCIFESNAFSECAFKELNIQKNFVFVGNAHFFCNKQLKNVTFESPDTKVSVGTFNICDNLSIASQAEIKKHKTDNQ